MIEPALNPGADPKELGRPTWVRWRILAIVMAIAFMNHFNRLSMSVAGTDAIMRDYSIEPTRMGFVYSAFLIVYTLAMLPGGWLIDRYGPRLALTVMGLGTGFFCALTGAVGVLGLGSLGVWVGLLCVRGLMGLCAAPLHPAGGKVVNHWFPPGRRVLANGLVVGASSIGMALVFKVFGALIDRVGWPTAFLCTGTVTALLGLVWRFYATDWPAQHPGTSAAERALIGPEHSSAMATRHRASFLSELRLVARNRSLLLLTVSYMAIGYFEYLFFYWMHY
ncbi:MAG TPA: MFS transporter [Isosphaeraceae bacterium]|nr:MFS transporter [Isosphaeraceae bacterium]